MNPRLLASILVILSLGVLGLGYGVWHFHADAGQLRMEIDALQADHAAALTAKDQELQQTLAAQNDQHQKALQALTEEYDGKLSELRQNQRKQLASAYKEFENIFADNRKTLEYINLLEGKVRGGQNLSKIELEKLTVITTGISFLQKQYQKPLQEFTVLQEFLAEQTSRGGEKPRTKFSFFKRMFSKDFREAEREYYREEGAKRAFEQAQETFNVVYASAQRSMRTVNLDADAQLRKLDELMEDKRTANAEDLSGFFNQARQALRTHQNVLDFDPDTVPQAPKVQP